MDPTSRPLPTKITMVNAFLKRKKKYEDVFFVGVKSTGILHKSTCTVRKPEKKNMDFFSSPKVALDYGYRPCKVCHPMLPIDETPGGIKELLNKVDHDPEYKIKDSELIKQGMDPNKLRRWFKKHHGITFQAYLKYNRINHQFGNICYNKKLLVHQAYHTRKPLNQVSEEKENYKEDEIPKQWIAVSRIETPIGPLLAGANKDGICLLEFTDRRMLETQIKILEKRLNAELYSGKSPYFESLAKQIDEYFSGKRTEFDIPLITPGTPFQTEVWKAISTVPFGKIRTYKQQSIQINNPKAVRAVGHANGDNRIAIIIPCHRIVGNNGALVGYGGGLWRKRFLLELENPNQTKMFV
jgi:AraC family transcriptional regulator of adaptative response/methylated-DNA-[protein]-cysteine methyltransferase